MITARRRLTKAILFTLTALAFSAAKCYAQVVTSADLFRRYATAAGGTAAIRAVKTQVMRGKVIAPGGTATLQIVQAAPDKFLRVIDSPVSGHSENAFNGVVAWTKNSSGVRELTGPPAAMVKRELHLYRTLVIADFYGAVATPRDDTLGGATVYAVDATAKDGTKETLYFDRGTGLLAGWSVAIGETSLRSVLDDYRAVNGVMIPFRVKRSRPDFSWVEEFTSVEHNVVVDTMRFAKPGH